MPPFHTIAVPHDDILAGRLTMDVFAADLWEVHRGRGPDEYRDPDRFFQKTHMTEGLGHLLAVVEKRLSGRGGDPVIQLQTPFGGGKTHALIALYHKAAEWGANRAAIVGTALDATRDPLWAVLAEQLAGRRDGFEQPTAPGREALRGLLADRQPLVILVDELLEYVPKAAGVRVGGSTLADQTLAFFQELTETAASLERVCVLATLTSRAAERYGESAEEFSFKVQKVLGRMEKIYTPVEEHEITAVVRRRLFSQVHEAKARRVIKRFVDYAEREGLLPPGEEPSAYSRRFLASYPFLPEVIGVLYHRWGSFLEFQRTRGVLRLLALVLHDLKTRNLPYVTLSDFNLSNQEIRRELLKHIGPQFDSVIAADITDTNAGARRVDAEMGASLRGLALGTRAATAIFLHSFTGAGEAGATMAEIKRHAALPDIPASTVVEAVHSLYTRTTSYLHKRGELYCFTSQPNLEALIRAREEDVGEDVTTTLERERLARNLRGRNFKVHIWPESDGDIPDTPDLKLIVLREPPAPQSHAEGFMKRCLEQKGMKPRVHRNSLVFLCTMENERLALDHALRKFAAASAVQHEKAKELSKEMKSELKAKVKEADSHLNTQVRRAYRLVFTPAEGGGFRRFDLGVPSHGTDLPIDDEAYDLLRHEQEILERIEPRVLKERFLKDRQWVSTAQLADGWSRTPGAMRVPDPEAWRQAIASGVERGLFGFGTIEGGEPRCAAFKTRPKVELADDEAIIAPSLCPAPGPQEPIETQPAPYAAGQAGAGAPAANEGAATVVVGRQQLALRFQVPKGQVSSLLGVLNLLQQKFDTLELTIRASGGELSDLDYETKLLEAFRQMGIEPEELGQ